MATAGLSSSVHLTTVEFARMWAQTAVGNYVSAAGCHEPLVCTGCELDAT